MQKTFYLLSKTLAFFAGLALLFMLTHVTADVIGKYFFNTPIPGTSEVVASYYMIAAVFLPLAYLEATNRSIMVELFYDLMPRLPQKGCQLLGTLCSFLFFLFLAKEGWQIALKSFEIREIVEGAWKVVVWPSRFLIPIGLITACAVLALRFFLLLTAKKG